MKAEEIKDEETLKAWLNARSEASRQSDAIAIAQRCALRVFPLFAKEMTTPWAKEAELTALPLLRCLLTAGVARIYPTAVATAADEAVSGTYGAPDSAHSAVISAANSAAKSAHASHTAYGYAASAAAYAAAYAAAFTAQDAASIAADHAANAALHADTSADQEAAFWDRVDQDAKLLEGGADLFNAAPLSAVFPD